MSEANAKHASFEVASLGDVQSVPTAQGLGTSEAHQLSQPMTEEYTLSLAVDDSLAVSRRTRL
jgi:hypothetical protein